MRLTYCVLNQMWCLLFFTTRLGKDACFLRITSSLMCLEGVQVAMVMNGGGSNWGETQAGAALRAVGVRWG